MRNSQERSVPAGLASFALLSLEGYSCNRTHLAFNLYRVNSWGFIRGSGSAQSGIPCGYAAAGRIAPHACISVAPLPAVAGRRPATGNAGLIVHVIPFRDTSSRRRDHTDSSSAHQQEHRRCASERCLWTRKRPRTGASFAQRAWAAQLWCRADTAPICAVFALRVSRHARQLGLPRGETEREKCPGGLRRGYCRLASCPLSGRGRSDALRLA